MLRLRCEIYSWKGDLVPELVAFTGMGTLKLKVLTSPIRTIPK
jgi:hypothetical protein